MRNQRPRSWNNGPRSRYNGPHYNNSNNGPGPYSMTPFHMNSPPSWPGPGLTGRGRGFHPQPLFMAPVPMPLFHDGGPAFPPSGPSMMHRGGGSGSFPARGGMKRERGFGTLNNKRNKTLRADGEFQCDTCDRNYETRELLNEHFATHRKCDVNGCAFTAHPKIMEMHVKLQHETGLADKIMHLKSADDIEKWKCERRKNFPSAENVARRQAEQAEKLARGELVQDKEFGKFNNMRGQRGRGRGGRGSVMNKQILSGTSHQQSCAYPTGIADPGYISFEDEPPKANDKAAKFARRGRFVRGRGRGRGRGQSRRPFRGKRRPPTEETGPASRAGIQGFMGIQDSPVSITIVSANNAYPMAYSETVTDRNEVVGSNSVANGNQPLEVIVQSGT